MIIHLANSGQQLPLDESFDAAGRKRLRENYRALVAGKLISADGKLKFEAAFGLEQ